MRYIGGKSRHAKAIVTEILKTPNRTGYVEPFLGGASVAETIAPHFDPTLIRLSDIVPDVALMWNAAANENWTPPTTVSETLYQEAKTWTDPSPLRGFIGFGCSFGGKWFGGYARGTKTNGGKRDFANEAHRRVTRVAQTLKNTEISRLDYRDATVKPGDIVYCDPPYAGTTGYSAAGKWCHKTFWKTAENWTKIGATVYVSEYQAPENWITVWEKEHRQSLQGGNTRPLTTEKLFTYKI